MTREITGMASAVGRARIICLYERLVKGVPKVVTGKGAVMNGNGQTLWVNYERNVR
jgi:hypothetical protein